jgi:hypothetical protein
MTRDSSADKIGRLAMRREGDMWNAYYAMPDTMLSALFLGSIAIRFVVDNDERKAAFMGMMCEAVSEIIEEKTGQQLTWPNGPQPAPEHEKAGSA